MRGRSSRGDRWARKGKGLLPGNPGQWENEHNGLDVRESLGLGLEERLPVKVTFCQLLKETTLRPHGDIPCAQKFIDRFRTSQQSAWSAMAVPLPDGEVVVIFNDSHSPTRIRATLMEEFFHLWLGHPPSKLRCYCGSQNGRSFKEQIESEAYGSGAAALIPFKPLRQMVLDGLTVRAIANQFDVSPELVEFRAKLTKQYKRLKNNGRL
jgi:IrrE N-terminal-like domain